MRKRHPGFYVSVPGPTTAEAGSANIELLDGPWPTRENAERRAAKIHADRPRQTSIVRVAEDGITIIRDSEEQ